MAFARKGELGSRGPVRRGRFECRLGGLGSPVQCGRPDACRNGPVTPGTGRHFHSNARGRGAIRATCSGSGWCGPDTRRVGAGTKGTGAPVWIGSRTGDVAGCDAEVSRAETSPAGDGVSVKVVKGDTYRSNPKTSVSPTFLFSTQFVATVERGNASGPAGRFLELRGAEPADGRLDSLVFRRTSQRSVAGPLRERSGSGNSS
jgi:hypothetical protein